MAAHQKTSQRRHSLPDLHSSHKLSSGANELAKVALAGPAAKALLKKHRLRKSAQALHEGKSVQQICDEEAPPAEKKPKSRLQELWDKESILQLRVLPSQRNSSLIAEESATLQKDFPRRGSLPAMDAKLGSYEVGMVRLVNSVARDLHNHSSLQARKSFKQLGKDMHHSVRICSKAKDFVDLALDAQEKKIRESVDSDASQNTALAKEDVDTTSRPASATLDLAWAELIKDLDPMSPKSSTSLHRSWTTSSFEKPSFQSQQWR